MDIVRFHRELPYRESRRFKIPSEAGIAADCLLACRYLSNSHVADFKAPQYDSRFAFKMIAVLTQHNVSLGTVRMCAKEDGLSDYRSLDTIFNGGMSLAALEIRLFDHQFATLVKTTDFFRRPMVQRLETLKLTLVCVKRLPTPTPSLTIESSSCSDRVYTSIRTHSLTFYFSGQNLG